jgi:hypothetical protein
MASPMRESTMTQPTPDQVPKRIANPSDANPSDAYPPTRPGPFLIALAVVVVLVVAGIENWSDISPHVPQIAKAIGF